MKKIVLIGCCLLALASLAACETIVDVPEPPHTPRLAVRYVLGTAPADSATLTYFGHRQLYVSTSQRLYDSRPIQGRADATAQLLDEAGTVMEEFRPGPPYSYGYGPYGPADGYYRPTRGFAPQPGRTYRLRVAAPGVETVESSLTMPPAPTQILSARFTPRAGSDPYQSYGQLTVSIQDDAASTDAYLAFARLVDSTGLPLPNSYVFADRDDENGDTDVQGTKLLFSPAGADLSNLQPYPDDGVAGRAFPLTADLTITSYDPGTGTAGLPPGARIEITISRLTPDAYRFLLSLRRYIDTDGNIFAEPAPLTSNIPNGYGIFGGAVDAVVRVPAN